MKAITWILALATVAALLFLGATVTRDRTRTPADVFEAVQDRIARGRTDDEQLLSELDSALRIAVDRGDADTTAKVRRARARILHHLGADDDARRDLEAVLAHDPDDVEVDKLLIAVESSSGRFDAGIERAERLLATSDDQGDVWVALGDLYGRAAEQALRECHDSLRRVLISEDEGKAMALLERGAALDIGDPLRVAVGHRLGGLFADEDNERLQEARQTMDRASADHARARNAYAQSLEHALDPVAVHELMRLLRAAGRVDDVVDIGMAALRYPETRNDADTMRTLIELQTELGRDGFAAELATWWMQGDHPADADMFEAVNWAFVGADQRHRLPHPGHMLGVHGDGEQKARSLFFVGVGRTQRGTFDQITLSYLQRYLRVDRLEPYRGAHRDAMLSIAEVQAEIGAPWQELEAIEAAIELDPDDAIDGETWLRVSDLYAESDHGGYRLPEERFAQAMSRLPTRIEELWPRWEELGRLELASGAFDPHLARDEMVRKAVWKPSTVLSPYELWRLMLVHEEAEDYDRALAAAQRMLEKVPGFVATIDRAIEYALMEKHLTKVAADLVLQRMRLVGREDATVAFLERLPPDAFQGEDLVDLMRADPEHTGRIAVASQFRERGDDDRALTALGDLTADDLDPELRRLGIELLLDLGRASEALEDLETMELHPMVDPADRLVLVDAYLAGGDREGLRELVEELAASGEVDEASWIAIADRLSAAGEPDAAGELLRRLDETRGAETGGLLLRIGIATLLAGDLEEAREAALRAEAFPTQGRAELFGLFVRLGDHRWDELRSAVRWLTETEYELTPVQETALLILSDELPEARSRIARALRTSTSGPSWALLAAAEQALSGDPVDLPEYFGDDADAQAELMMHGTAEAPRDPRYAVGLVLALEDGVFHSWARGRLTTIGPEAGTLWPSYLAARALNGRRERAAKQAGFERLTREHPDFTPAWDGLDRLLLTRVQEWDSEERLDLRFRRRQAVGPLATDDSRALDNALAAARDGRKRKAIQALQNIARRDPQSVAVRWKLGSLYTESGFLDKAIPAYLAALEIATPASDLPLVTELLDTLSLAHRRGAIDTVELGEHLTTLAQRVPHDPAVALAHARYELEFDTRNPTLGVARAYAVLENFKDEHATTSLEDLRAGSAIQWGRFHLELDADVAREFIERELELQPGALDLWIFKGETLGALGDLEGALEHLEIARRMAPLDGRLLRQLAQLEARLGRGRKTVGERLTQIREVEGLAEADVELAYWRAMALYYGGTRSTRAAAGRMQKVWDLRAELPAHLELDLVGVRFAATLIARGTAEDRQLAREVLRGMERRITDPYRHDVARALYGMARHDPDPGEG